MFTVRWNLKEAGDKVQNRRTETAYKAKQEQIRDRSEGHEKLGKGVTLTGEKVKKLRDILNKIEL